VLGGHLIKSSVRPELVEGVFFRIKERFDKLNANGINQTFPGFEARYL
jgi:hypothetical protein